jgi:hypothetical protein
VGRDRRGQVLDRVLSKRQAEERLQLAHRPLIGHAPEPLLDELLDEVRVTRLRQIGLLVQRKDAGRPIPMVVVTVELQFPEDGEVAAGLPPLARQALARFGLDGETHVAPFLLLEVRRQEVQPDRQQVAEQAPFHRVGVVRLSLIPHVVHHALELLERLGYALLRIEHSRPPCPLWPYFRKSSQCMAERGP